MGKVKIESVRAFAVILMIISLSIGNIINYRSITIYKISSIIIFFSYLYFWFRTGKRIFWNIFFTFLGLFVLANLCMFGILRNPHPIREKLFFIARLSGHSIVIFLLYNFLYGVKTEKLNRYLTLILYISSPVNILVIVIQYVNGTFLPTYLQAYERSGYVRYTGLFMDPNYNGFFICICILLLFYLYTSATISKKVFILLLIGNLAALFLTLSFGAFIGFFLTVIILIFVRSGNRMRIVFGISVLCVIVAVFFTILFIRDYEFEGKDITNFQNKIIYYTQTKLSPGSGGTRLDHYKISIKAFQKNPVFGIGTVGFLSKDNYNKYSEGLSIYNKHPREWIIHSNVFAVLSENGLAGFIPYMGMVILGIMYSWKLYKKNNRFLYLLGMQIASFLISNSINNLYFNFFWFILFLPFLFYSSFMKLEIKSDFSNKSN